MRIITKKVFKVIIIVIFISQIYVNFLTCNTIAADTILVPGDYTSIQDAIDAAISGDIILVSAGAYHENIELKSGVILRGGGADVTSIDGGGSGSVVIADEVGSATKIEGFTLTNGYAANGGGMLTIHSSLTVQNCIFISNTATNNGGGMSNGRGLLPGTPTPKIINCIFVDNSAEGLGGGGIYNNGVNPYITNCVVYDNSGFSGGGVYNYASSPKIANCVFWGDSPNEITNTKGSAPTVSYCVIQYGYTGGTSIITSNPSFNNPSNGDFHLSDGSPCIDAGDNTASYLPDVDMDGYERVYNGQVDIGVYEYGSSEPLNKYTLSVSIDPSNAGSVYFEPSGGQYNEGTPVTIIANPNTSYTFSHWSGDASGNDNPLELIMDDNKAIIAHFIQPTQNYTITMFISPSGSGTVTYNPSQDFYEENTVVTITAIPTTGYTFSQWSGDLSGSTNPTTLPMTSNKVVTAHFIASTTERNYTLILNISPSASGIVTANPQNEYYLENTPVTLTATPNAGYTFLYWGGDISGTDNPLMLIMDENKIITAYFTPTSMYKPTITITKPMENSTINGTIIITGTAEDTQGTVSLVQIKINNGSWINVNGTTTWSYVWNTTNIKNGNYTIYARCYNGESYSEIANIRTNVQNNVSPDTPGFQVIICCVAVILYYIFKTKKKQ